MSRTISSRVYALSVAALLASGALVGCGGSDDDKTDIASVNDEPSSSASDGSGKKKSNAEQAQEFVDCMRKNGVNVVDPDPVTGNIDFQDIMASGADMPTLQTAVGACQDKAPQGLMEHQTQKPNAEQLADMKKFAACMREEGVEMDDPGPDGFENTRELMNDPNFQDGMKKCRDYLNSLSGNQ
ncbi:hypothetical protein [Streptomyces sp. NBC_00035]|uniref:hypothetical protein n=1 Tax=Streptomyces sp. NBC_00035 TaxID=2903614 RepID=UPI0032529333